MNINNINNQPNAPDQVSRNRGITERRNANRVDSVEREDGATPDAVPAGTGTDSSPVRPTRDMFQTTADRSFVGDMTGRVEDMENETREELVAQVRDRVSRGYYNSRESMGNVALRLINTERTA